MPLIKIADLAYFRIKAPNLSDMRAFFADFGLVEANATDGTVYFRGYGPEPYLMIVTEGGSGLEAIGLSAETRDDLLRIAESTGGDVTERQEPGGGLQTSVRDPDGNRIELVWGLESAEPIEVPRQMMNDSRDRLRRAGELFRPTPGPSHILRLGHVAITTPNPTGLASWYRETFGFLISDEIYAGDENNVLLSFNRLDRGEEYVDHHAFLTLPGRPGGVHHISFEVFDLDDLYVGHEHLMSKGYRHMWGVGRHKQGSQIFDYWIDPTGMMFEHWTDTDVLNAQSPPGREAVEAVNGPWGPPTPPEFVTQVA